MSDTNHNKTPTHFKNDILSNMIQKFSEEAKKQFELSAFSKKPPLQEGNQDINLINEDNLLLKESSNTFLNQDKAPFTGHHIFNKLASPSDFLYKKQLHNVNHEYNKNEDNSKSYLRGLIYKNQQNITLSHVLKNISLTKWMNMFTKFINSNIESIEEMINQLACYSFEAKSTLCEVKEVTVLDCIQIITVKDIRLTEKKIILTKNNGNHESVRDIIDDYYLKEGDVFLCNNKLNYNSDFIRLNINDIQK